MYILRQYPCSHFSIFTIISNEENIASMFSRNSKAIAANFFEESFPRYYNMHSVLSGRVNASKFSNTYESDYT